MNLEDFKSFCRVLIPSGVGSIPTHSRQALGMALVVLVGTTRAWGAEAVLPGTPSPLQRAVRSAAVPAWGQLTNGKSTKAVVLLSVQTYIYTRVVLESRRAGESQRRAEWLRRMDTEDAVVASLLTAAEVSSQEHFDRRRNLLFWAIVAGFYGAIDAYIDAHLGDFEGDLEKDGALFARVDPGEGAVELGLRF